MTEPKVTDRIDKFTVPHFDFPDPKITAFVGAIAFEIRMLQEGHLGPYGAIEGIISALEDFAEDWNQ